MKMKNVKFKITLGLCAAIIISCLVSIPCFAKDNSVHSAFEPEHVNDIILGKDGAEILVKVYDDGTFITELITTEPKAVKNCPHLEYRDVGKTSIVYRKVDSSQHKRGTRQPMQCIKCHKQSARYYGWKYLSHSFNKKKVCTFCNYKK